ncbi:ExbD/TolR family protein [Candidatus Marinarcus aquaticus]|uniref:Biopolymer transporter ExbD n=1 Tax=Candidatus Marinarcus aquaticus TaxID=2044504 RepID=A0A4Q0XQ01_9BACT|nr:biopolymer transporter ExbD [Candidatus Marinarcus aquaticus]RXJ57584.1 biopolymer transporter ExbD [Candidatus Marinarcus aquaticus]
MKRREKLNIDLTPLVDVVFILLIFFIVTSVFKKEELALILDLPSSDAKEAKYEEKNITIELGPDKLAYKGKVVNLNELNLALMKIRNKQDSVILRIDKNVKYQKVVEVLDVLQRHKLNNLALITDE